MRALLASVRRDRWTQEHPRVAARLHLGSGAVLAGLGLVTLRFGGRDRKTYGWASVFLALAAAHVAVAHRARTQNSRVQRLTA